MKKSYHIDMKKRKISYIDQRIIKKFIFKRYINIDMLKSYLINLVNLEFNYIRIINEYFVKKKK